MRLQFDPPLCYPERPHIEHVDVEALLQHAHSADDLPGQCQPAPAVVPALAHQCRRCCRRRRRCCNRRLLRELFNVVVAEQRHHREGGVCPCRRSRSNALATRLLMMIRVSATPCECRRCRIQLQLAFRVSQLSMFANMSRVGRFATGNLPHCVRS